MLDFPKLNDIFALRQIGDELFYLMDPTSGDYYEVDKVQFEALRMSDGSYSIEQISDIVGIDSSEVKDFFEEQQNEGILKIYDKPQDPSEIHYRKSQPPHFSDVLVEITGECNLQCRHCFNSKFNSDELKNKLMSIDQIRKLISELDDMNVRRIQLSGGEPLLREDIWSIIEELDKHKIYLDVISTNAHLIDEESAKKFGERFKEHGALYISLDGITADTYEALRGEDTFPKIMRAMDLLTEAGCRVFINTMAFKQNLSQLEEMYEWVVKRPNVMGWRIGLPKVLGRYTEFHSHLEVEFDEVIKVFRNLLVRWLKERPSIRLELSDFFRTDCFESGFEVHGLEDNPCKYAVTNASIKPDGTAVFCASLEIHEPAVLGNVVNEGMADVWYGDRHMDFRKLKIKDLPECSKCRYLKMCGGGCRSNALLSYDSITAPDPRACTAMEMLENEILDLLPKDVADEINKLIDRDIPFSMPTEYKKFI
jgi:radical SAM protein with 4Fe4S-binding SPASM domain